MKSMRGGEPSLSSSPSWFRRHTTRCASSRLVCFPFAGGGASAFAGWQSSLEGIEVVGVRLPGREIRLREQRFRDARRAAFSLSDAIVQQVEPPFEFFGHSMGALLAYEVCRELERRGAALPRQLIVSARSAPQIPVTSRLYRLADGALLDVIQSYGGTPSDVLNSDYFRRYFLSMIRDDFEMVENYEYNPAPPLNLPIVALAAEEDLLAPLSNVLRWSEATAVGFCIHRFPGGHFFIQQEREQVLRCLSSVLAR